MFGIWPANRSLPVTLRRLILLFLYSSSSKQQAQFIVTNAYFFVSTAINFILSLIFDNRVSFKGNGYLVLSRRFEQCW